jgi:hypothetical protein
MESIHFLNEIGIDEQLTFGAELHYLDWSEPNLVGRQQSDVQKTQKD